MSFQVSVQDHRGRRISPSDLEAYVIEKENYYQKIGEIDRRLARRERKGDMGAGALTH